MNHQHHSHKHFHHARREAEAETHHLLPRDLVEPVVDAPPSRTIIERTKALLPRAASCNASDANLCEKPTSSNTLPIVLAAVYVMYLCTYPVSTNLS